MLSWLLSAALAAGVPESGQITCQTDHYTVAFSAEQAWTIYSIKHDGQNVGLSNGFYGTVMCPKGGQWWGTGHSEGGREVVNSLKLTVDGLERPVKVGETIGGHRITLLKDSTIWKFKCQAEVTLTDNQVYERTQLEAMADCEQSLMYYFMHAWLPTTTKWIAQLPDGKLEEGALLSDENMKVNKDTRWVAQFEPNLKLGILCYTPKVISGPGSASLIWDKKHYHKSYYRSNEARSFKAGEKLDYSVVVKVAADETGDWVATKAAAEALAKSYPPE